AVRGLIGRFSRAGRKKDVNRYDGQNREAKWMQCQEVPPTGGRFAPVAFGRSLALWRSARRSDRPKQPGSNLAAPRECVCLSPATDDRLPLPIASVSSDSVVGPKRARSWLLSQSLRHNTHPYIR